MKYDGFKETNFKKIKNANLSNFIIFEYAIDKSNLGKKLQGIYVRNYIKSCLNLLFTNNIPNIVYKKINYNSEKYSKDWWKI